jgi:glycosyltransferase involved in cell wall biosynthesis
MIEPGLVSVIIPTYNSGHDIRRCIDSIRNQDYDAIEIIVVDKQSSDNTSAIARQRGAKVVSSWGLRSTARNLGSQMASGEYLLFVDSDMELTSQVVRTCVEMSRKHSFAAVTIAERRLGEGFWAKCRAFEREMYVGDPLIESARFVRVAAFVHVGGFDESIEAGEDWDLQAKLEQNGFAIGKVFEAILHHEGKLTLQGLVRKRVYYGKTIINYIRKNRKRALIQYSPVRLNYVRNYRSFVSSPLVASGFLFMKFVEYWSTLLSLPMIGSSKMNVP